VPVFTEVLPINNAAGASFQLPSTEDVKIMAVRVTIDNSGGTDTEPELALLAPTGAVIATERQSEAIPAGDSGMASWALRLAKKAKATGSGFSWCAAWSAKNFTVAPGASAADLIITDTNDPAAFVQAGTTPERVRFDKTGTYLLIFAFDAIRSPAIANPWTTSLQGGPGNFPGSLLFGPMSFGDAVGSSSQHWSKTWTMVRTVSPLETGSTMNWNWNNLTGGTLQSVFGGVVVIRLPD
jgi:hypothetical protein